MGQLRAPQTLLILPVSTKTYDAKGNFVGGGIQSVVDFTVTKNGETIASGNNVQLGQATNLVSDPNPTLQNRSNASQRSGWHNVSTGPSPPGALLFLVVHSWLRRRRGRCYIRRFWYCGQEGRGPRQAIQG
jgi:MYXO-CTERM domain-containing protein